MPASFNIFWVWIIPGSIKSRIWLFASETTSIPAWSRPATLRGEERKTMPFVGWGTSSVVRGASRFAMVISAISPSISIVGSNNASTPYNCIIPLSSSNLRPIMISPIKFILTKKDVSSWLSCTVVDDQLLRPVSSSTDKTAV